MTQSITSLRDLIQVVADQAKRVGTTLWWRGHADASWPLVPAAFRGGRTFHAERNALVRFMAKARTRRADCPSDGDFGSWLALMQHYRLPTRLLDWTELPLVAAFFAVSELPDADGIVWMLNPTSLNKALLGTPTLQGSSGPQAKVLVRQAFTKGAVSEGRVLALTPWETDIRMLLQGSAFTIHDGPSPLQEHVTASESLVGFHIPAQAKRGLQQHLNLLGIRRSNLFPDLDNLAVDVAALEFVDPAAE